MHRKKRHGEEGYRTLQALAASHSGIGNLGVNGAEKCGDRIRKRQHQERNEIQQPVSARETEQHSDCNGKVKLPMRRPIDRVEASAQPVAKSGEA